MGLRIYNVQIGPRGRTTSIVSHDNGVTWQQEDGTPVSERDVCQDSAGGDFLVALLFVGVVMATFFLSN